MKKKSPFHQTSMWQGAPASSFRKAQTVRNNMTKAESLLWNSLKNKQLSGLKFRRQHPIHFFIVDFYCHKLKLVVEVDGGYHLQNEQIIKDKERTKILECNGLKVIRFTNKQVLHELEWVLNEIQKFNRSTQ